jgi:hypothetical protein
MLGTTGQFDWSQNLTARHRKQIACPNTPDHNMGRPAEFNRQHFKQKSRVGKITCIVCSFSMCCPVTFYTNRIRKKINSSSVDSKNTVDMILYQCSPISWFKIVRKDATAKKKANPSTTIIIDKPIRQAFYIACLIKCKTRQSNE